MKKYYLILFSLICLLCMLPSNVFAYVDSSWHVPYNSGAVNQYTSYAGYWGTWSNTITGTNSNGTAAIYFSDITMPAGRNDYIEFPIFIYVQPLNVYAASDEYIHSTCSTSGDCYDTMDFSGWVTFDAETGFGDQGGYTNTLCTLFPSQSETSRVISGTLRCNLNGLSNSLHYIRATYSWQGNNSNQEYRFFFGTSGWVNFIPHDSDVGSNSIVSAQNQTTAAVNAATAAIESQNNLINDSSTTDANNTGKSFFDNFSVSSQSGLTTLITAPLTLVNSLTDTCQPITLTYNFDTLYSSHDFINATQPADKSVSLPCGDTLFWGNQNLGSKVSTFRSFWNVLFGGAIIYALTCAVMKEINKALDPMEDGLIFLGDNAVGSSEEYQPKHEKGNIAVGKHSGGGG